jgi:hypothetical protein
MSNSNSNVVSLQLPPASTLTSTSTSPVCVGLLIVFSAVIAFAMFIMGFKEPATLVMFVGIITAVLAMGLFASYGPDYLKSIFRHPITAVIVLACVAVLMLVVRSGRTFERVMVIIGLLMFSVMLILFPHMVKRQLLRFVGVQTPIRNEWYIATGGALYAITTILNAHLKSD